MVNGWKFCWKKSTMARHILSPGKFSSVLCWCYIECRWERHQYYPLIHKLIIHYTIASPLEDYIPSVVMLCISKVEKKEGQRYFSCKYKKGLLYVSNTLQINIFSPCIWHWIGIILIVFHRISDNTKQLRYKLNE